MPRDSFGEGNASGEDTHIDVSNISMLLRNTSNETVYHFLVFAFKRAKSDRSFLSVYLRCGCIECSAKKCQTVAKHVLVSIDIVLLRRLGKEG